MAGVKSFFIALDNNNELNRPTAFIFRFDGNWLVCSRCRLSIVVEYMEDIESISSESDIINGIEADLIDEEFSELTDEKLKLELQESPKPVNSFNYYR